MKYLGDSKSGFRQSAEAQVFHDRANDARSELTKFIVSISTAAIAFIYLDSGVNSLSGFLEKCLTWGALIAFFTAASASVLAWHYDAQRFYFRAKSIEAEDAEKSGSLYGRSKRLTSRARMLAWTGRAMFVFGISGLLVLAILRA